MVVIKRVENEILLYFLGFWNNYASCMAWRFCIQLFSQTVSFGEHELYGMNVHRIAVYVNCVQS